MVVDYSGRKPVPKNRPRKQPIGIFAMILLCAVLASFAIGLATGWLLRKPATNAARSQPAAVGEKSAPQVKGVNPEAVRGADPPLTFYETLPKGGKAIIGSGLNPNRSAEPAPQPAATPLSPQPAVPRATTPPVAAPPQSAPPRPVAQQGAAPPSSPGKPEERKEQRKVPAPSEPVRQSDAASQSKGESPKEKRKEPADTAKKGTETSPVAAPKQPDAGRFSVQVAATQDRKEAETLKAKLTEKGLPAYIVESNIKEIGTWFRVRTGRHLSRQEAAEIAAKAGKGAMVIPD